MSNETKIKSQDKRRVGELPLRQSQTGWLWSQRSGIEKP